VAAAPWQRHHAPSVELACDLAPEDCRQLGRRGIVTAPDQNVHEVHAGRAHMHDRLTLGIGDVGELEPLRPAELPKQNSLQDAAGSAVGSESAAGASGNISRNAVLRNFPTAVFGISSTNTNASGSHHFAKSAVRNPRRSSSVADCPSRRTQT